MPISSNVHSQSRSSCPSDPTNHHLSTEEGQTNLTTSNGSSDAVADASTEVGSHLSRRCPVFKLPNELLVRIVGLLYNEELVSFATACRRFHDLAGRALQEHRQLLLEWTTVTNLNKPPGYLASKVIRHIKNHRLRSYTHCLEIELVEPQHSFDGESGALDPRIMEALSDDIRPFAIEKFGLDFWKVWERDVKRGRIDSILWTFIMLLDNVTFLTLYLSGLGRDLLLELFDSSSKLWPVSLDNLQSVSIDQCTVEESPLSYRLLELFARLTSVTELRAANITLGGLTDHPITSTHYVSSVESFTLERCYLGTRHLLALVSKMTSLDHFSHREHWIDSGRGNYTDQSAVVDSLRIAASQSLTSLELVGQVHRAAQGDYGSLEGFEVLQYITLDFETFYRTLGQRSSTDSQTRLPKAVQWLKLVSSFGTVDASSVQIMLSALLWDKSERLPDLEDLFVIGIVEMEAEKLIAAQVVQELETVGVKVTLTLEEDDDNDGEAEDEDMDDADG